MITVLLLRAYTTRRVRPYTFFFFFFSLSFPFFFFSFFTTLKPLYFLDSGQAVVTGIVLFTPPRLLPLFFIAHRVQQSHCSSIFHRMLLLAHAVALSASQFYNFFPRTSAASSTNLCKNEKVPTNSHLFYFFNHLLHAPKGWAPVAASPQVSYTKSAYHRDGTNIL